MSFSADVIETILSHLSVKDLLSCRFVTKSWNNAALLNLKQRSTMIKNISEEEELKELEECMRKSSDFPFEGLTFDKPWLLKSDRTMEFFENYGPGFTRLCLNTSWEYKLHHLAPFIDHFPSLLILEVGQEESCPPMRLFKSGRQKDSKILKLPSVKILRISRYAHIHVDVLYEIVAAASPSLQIECLQASPEILGVLKRAKNLRKIFSAGTDGDKCGKYFELKSKQFSARKSPVLTKLLFTTDGCLSFNGLIEILLLSQHTLKDLRLDGMRLRDYSWEKFPVFTKLTTLSLHGEFEVDQNKKHVFHGQQGNKFPALKELNFSICCGAENLTLGWSDGQFIVPSVTKIDFEGYVSADGMKQLARSFPNVTEVGLKHKYFTNADFNTGGCRNAHEIWNVKAFKQMEKLKIWDVVVKRQTKNVIFVDSFVTGIPPRTYNHLQIRTPLIADLINGPQLKHLKKLIFCVHLERGLENLSEDPSFMSMIAEYFDLKIMPNLLVKFVFEYFSSTLLHEEENKAD